MNAKTNKTVYWTSTILFGGFMMFSSITNISPSSETIAFFNSIGYPAYIIPFLGWAKIMGSIVLLTPTKFRIKEWAYAGLMFDLIGALFSITMSFGFAMSSVIICFPIVVLLVSYITWLRLEKKATTLTTPTH